MSIHKRVFIELTQDTGDKNSWSISFSREGDDLQVGLHWAGRPNPTHLFTTKFNKFKKELGELK